MTVEDLSHLAANSIAPTSQHGGNRPSDNAAMTAPGSASPSVDTGDVTPVDQFLDVPPADDSRVSVERAHDTGPSDVFHDFPDAPRVVRGQWNNISGGAR